MTTKNDLGQYFTTNEELKDTVYKFILNNPSVILEPSIGHRQISNFYIPDKYVSNNDQC
jgi:hypothetical protein